MEDTELHTHILVIHVRGNDTRKQYMEKQLEALGYPYHFILDGNIEDLSFDIIDKYFADNGSADTMYGAFPKTSCAYKHILAMKYILENDLKGALIIEDDLRIKNNFKEVFTQSIAEYKKYYYQEPFIANYEESSLMLVPKSKRRKGKILYKATRDRFAGCIYINAIAATAILQYINKYKSTYTSDELHNNLIKQNIINYYWSHPCIACQCSCDGSMPTMIPTKPRPLKRFKWLYKKVYKHFLYWIR